MYSRLESRGKEYSRLVFFRGAPVRRVSDTVQPVPTNPRWAPFRFYFDFALPGTRHPRCLCTG